MKLHDILNDESDKFYFFREDSLEKFYYKNKLMIYAMFKKSYMRSIEFNKEPNGLEDIEIFFITDSVFSIEDVVSDYLTKAV